MSESQSEIEHNNNNSKLTKISQPPTVRIIPPLNFCPVEKQLYRSGQPSIINQSFLQDLNLKTILWLASEEPQEDFLDYCSMNNIAVEFVGLMNEYSYQNVEPMGCIKRRYHKESIGIDMQQRKLSAISVLRNGKT